MRQVGAALGGDHPAVRGSAPSRPPTLPLCATSRSVQILGGIHMGVGRIAAITALAALALPTAASAGEPRSAPDCRFEGASSYESFGRVRVFMTGGDLFGCLTDVGRAYRLDTGTMRARSSATRRTVFGVGDWVGFPARDRSGTVRVRALNLRNGRGNAAMSSGTATALVVNFDGTLAWISGSSVHTKARGSDRRTLATETALDRRFLGVENDQGCVVTWRVGGENRSGSIFCRRP